MKGILTQVPTRIAFELAPRTTHAKVKNGIPIIPDKSSSIRGNPNKAIRIRFDVIDKITGKPMHQVKIQHVEALDKLSLRLAAKRVYECHHQYESIS